MKVTATDNNKVLILCKYINDESTIKHIFDSETGFIILKAIDNILETNNNTITFSRKIGSLSFTICENNYLLNKEKKTV